MDQEEGLARERSRSAIADLAEPQLGNLDAGTESVSTAAPVRHAVDSADWVGPEAIDGAGGRQGPSTAEISVTTAVVFGG